MTDVFTRLLTADDAVEMQELYCAIASHPGGFARAAEEITEAYVQKTLRGVAAGGLGVGAIERASGRLVGFIVARKPGPKVFDHVLSDLTIGVHPTFQRKGIGRRLFLDFLDHVQISRSDILRVELLVRESNQRSISFYESIGFRREGSFEKRIRNANGEFEADVPMGWLKPGS